MKIPVAELEQGQVVPPDFFQVQALKGLGLKNLRAGEVFPEALQIIGHHRKEVDRPLLSRHRALKPFVQQEVQPAPAPCFVFLQALVAPPGGHGPFRLRVKAPAIVQSAAKKMVLLNQNPCGKHRF